MAQIEKAPAVRAGQGAKVINQFNYTKGPGDVNV